MRKKTSVSLDVETLEYLHYLRENYGHIIGRTIDNIIKERATDDNNYQQHKKENSTSKI
jgi:hypothetical protein